MTIYKNPLWRTFKNVLTIPIYKTFWKDVIKEIYSFYNPFMTIYRNPLGRTFCGMFSLFPFIKIHYREHFIECCQYPPFIKLFTRMS